MRAQKPAWNSLCKYYFRLETSGWERLPEETSLLIGNHSGGSLTMDAWTFVFDWWRRFGSDRVLPCDRSRCPDGDARPRRLLPRGRRDPSLPRKASRRRSAPGAT
jgi:hypothetical protein